MRYLHTSRRREGGQAMIMATVFFVIISTMMILAISIMAASSQELAKQYLDARTSFYVAQSGLEFALYNRLHGLPAGSAPVVGGLQATLETDISNGEEILTARAVANGAESIIEARLSTGSTTEILGWKELR